MSTSTIAPPGGLADEVGALVDQIERLACCPPTGARVAELGPLLVRLEHAQDRLAGIAAEWLFAFDAAGGPEEHGAPSLSAWSRRELRTTAYETQRRTKRARALRALPATRAALSAGRIGLAHVDAIAHGVQLNGAEVIEVVEPVLLQVAETCDADAVKATVRRVRDTLDPDAADAAYVRALERRDVTVTQIGEGFAVRGFLDPETGVAFKDILYSLAKRESVDDDRLAGQRRVDGLRDLCRSVLDHGLPTDRGLRPHLFVTVSADRLHAATHGLPPAGDPAMLHGFGRISDLILTRLACDCTITPVSVDPADGHVLDVGRASRLATVKQRQAILVQQDGVCFNPGCDRTRLEIHHLVPWSSGGATDMANLRGYCTRCHHLIHLGLLIVTPDGEGGWTHHTKHRQVLPHHRRRASNLTRVYLHALAHGGKAHALKVTRADRRAYTVIRT